MENIHNLTDKQLTAKSVKLFESLSCILDDDDIKLLNQLLELERELTLRENQ